ncbi:helix-turn-helix domain-containing protein [Ruegeria sp. ANG-S4]|uniref:helix-turn-helix domain-containing protein n=1 Tax=Ruegeria sp. ANG-S4 TaxID=1577904 RepID=UPI0009E55ED4
MTARLLCAGGLFFESKTHRRVSARPSCPFEEAKQFLEMDGHSVEAVSEAVGYSDSRAFRRLFKKMTGLSPAEYRRRFSSRGFLSAR